MEFNRYEVQFCAITLPGEFVRQAIEAVFYCFLKVSDQLGV